MKKVMVFGSFVVDLMSRTPHLPVPGETVKGSVFKLGPGGKGFNQGVAAHKAGAAVTMVTKLGRDTFGNVALNAMAELKMDSGKVIFTDESETGAALILVDEKSGQNEIVVVLGACDTISDEEVEALEEELKDCEYLLTQLETNVSSVEKVIEIAARNQVKIILNTAPVQPIRDAVLRNVDIITPNEVEAEVLTGVKVKDEASAEKAAAWFFDRGVRNVLITMGSRGVYVNTGDKKELIAAYKVEAVDTTGAGDAFNGGLLAALAEGKNLWQAVRFANSLAALSVQKIGTTPSMPTRVEIEKFIEDNGGSTC